MLIEISLFAQLAATGVPAVDSANVARSSWSAAVRAFRANDLPTARRDVSRSASAWPSQQAYIWGRAVMAARAGDSAETISALKDYAALGLGRELRSDTTFRAFAHASWFAPLIAAHEANRGVIQKSKVRHTLSDSTTWPEGLDYNPVSRRYYISSVRHRTI